LSFTRPQAADTTRGSEIASDIRRERSRCDRLSSMNPAVIVVITEVPPNGRSLKCTDIATLLERLDLLLERSDQLAFGDCLRLGQMV
jgi:hypothetical protein